MRASVRCQRIATSYSGRRGRQFHRRQRPRVGAGDDEDASSRRTPPPLASASAPLLIGYGPRPRRFALQRVATSSIGSMPTPACGLSSMPPDRRPSSTRNSAFFGKSRTGAKSDRRNAPQRRPRAAVGAVLLVIAAPP